MTPPWPVLSVVAARADVRLGLLFDLLTGDYLNPIDLCNKLNQFVLPEMIFHAAFTFLFLVCFQFFAFLLNLPLVAVRSRILAAKTCPAHNLSHLQSTVER